jgi:hypothetical protein
MVFNAGYGGSNGLCRHASMRRVKNGYAPEQHNYLWGLVADSEKILDPFGQRTGPLNH